MACSGDSTKHKITFLQRLDSIDSLSGTTTTKKTEPKKMQIQRKSQKMEGRLVSSSATGHQRKLFLEPGPHCRVHPSPQTGDAIFRGRRAKMNEPCHGTDVCGKAGGKGRALGKKRICLIQAVRRSAEFPRRSIHTAV